MNAKGNAWISSLVVAATTILLFARPVRVNAQASPAPGQTSAPQVRMRWQDFISGPDGAKRLANFEAAVQKMKSLDNSPRDSADYRRSWQYWANVHGYFGPASHFGTVAMRIKYLNSHGMGEYVPRYQAILDQSPPDSTAQAVWATCQHSRQNAQALNFFGWHRMYLYYFERVLRWAAADDSLRLPYWDYTDPAQEALPAEFQNQASTLYDSRRDPELNTGASTLDSNSTNEDGLLLHQGDFFTFEGVLEGGGGIHSYMHCTVGSTCPAAHMGDVPVAANDPIFYLHHANIDRLWACWQHLHGTPTGDWQNQPFSFVDENGAEQTLPVSKFVDASSPNYVGYDNDSNCTRGPASSVTSMTLSKQASPAAKETEMTSLGKTRSIQINRPKISVDVNVPKLKMLDLLAQPEGAAMAELVLTDVAADSPPGVLFNVYIAKKGAPSVRKFAGTISWFGAFDHDQHVNPEERTLRFDVTDQLRELGGVSDTSGLTVIIEATTGRVPSDKSKVQAMQAEAFKAFKPQAKLKIGSIELQQSTVPR
jgi:hypothetical protein